MSNLLTNFIDTVVPEGRRSIFHRADEVLSGIGHRTHHIAAENIVAMAEDMTTGDMIVGVEQAMVNSLSELISDYGIGVQTNDLNALTLILTGLHDLVGYADQQSVLDVIDSDDLPEEIFADLLALVYSTDSEFFLSALEYVQPSLIQQISFTASQRVDELDEVPEEVEDEPEAVDESGDAEPMVGEQTRAIVKAFVNRHQPERFIGMIHDGARLGYSLATYLNQTLRGDETDPEVIAREYMAAALATGEDAVMAVQKASDRLEARVVDIHLLQQVLQRLRQYLNEGVAS